MDAYRLSPGDDRLADLVGRVEDGESVEIERGGRIVARIVPADVRMPARPTFDLAAYFASIEHLPAYRGNSVVEMREEARY